MGICGRKGICEDDELAAAQGARAHAGLPFRGSGACTCFEDFETDGTRNSRGQPCGSKGRRDNTCSQKSCCSGELREA